MESFGSPLAEACTLNRFYTIAYRDDNIKIVVFYLFTLCFPFYSAMLSGLSEFPTDHFFFQFSFLENIGNMFTNSGTPFIEQLRYLFNIQPHGLVLQSHIKSHSFVRLVNNHFAKVCLYLILPFVATIHTKMNYSFRLYILRVAFWTSYLIIISIHHFLICIRPIITNQP